MKQTDGLTDARQFYRPCCAYYVDRTAKLFGVLLVDAFFCALFYIGFCIVLYFNKKNYNYNNNYHFTAIIQVTALASTSG